MSAYNPARNVTRDRVQLAGRLDDEVRRCPHRRLIEGGEVKRGHHDGWTDLRPSGDNLAFGDRVVRARDRRVEQGREVDVVEIPPPLQRLSPEGTLSELGPGQQDRARQQRECMRDEAGSGGQQPAAGIERGLEDLLLERLVADDFSD